MSKTKIEWTDATWNPLRGCSRVSAGCDVCFLAYSRSCNPDYAIVAHLIQRIHVPPEIVQWEGYTKAERLSAYQDLEEAKK